MKKIIRNGMIATDSEVFTADILIDGEKISAVGTGLVCDDAEIIDATGKYVLPGAVDVHTHMDLDVGFARAIDDFYDGTVAAACEKTPRTCNFAEPTFWCRCAAGRRFF